MCGKQTIALLAVAVLATACGSVSPTPAVGEPAPTVTVTETVTASPEATMPAAAAPKPTPIRKPAATIENGTWVVGEDIPAGRYKVNAPVIDGCYWKITESGTNGANIIQNDLPSGGLPRVTLTKGQDFETEDCGTWSKQ